MKHNGIWALNQIIFETRTGNSFFLSGMRELVNRNYYKYKKSSNFAVIRDHSCKKQGCSPTPADILNF